jgi:hypothetical protein
MIKNLVAFGCGWTHGAELENPELDSYPGLLAEHFGWTLIDRTENNTSMPEMLSNFNDWIASTPKKEIDESLVLVGIPHETSTNCNTEDDVFEQAVLAFDSIASSSGIALLQFNVLARQHRMKVPTLIESSSALEMLVIRDKPRKDPLFTEHKFPNEKGHKIISEFLINHIDSAIMHE